MTFTNYEESRYYGAPVELYKFTYGPGADDFYAYTNAEQPIEIDGVAFAPVPIERDSVKSSGVLDKAAMSVRMAIDSEVAELFRVAPPSYVVSLIMWQGHADDPDAEFKVCWSGRVLGASRQGSTFTMTCEPVATSMKRPGLRRHYQYGCPHALYGAGCFADKVAATTITTAIAVNGNKVTLAGGWVADDRKPKHAGGLISWVAAGRTEVRTIMRVDGPANELTCSGLLLGLTPGASVSVILGCNRQMTDCQALHNNILNFGGHPWIPKKNPIGATNNYY